MPTHDDFSWTTPEELARRSEGDDPWAYYEQTAVYFEGPFSTGRVVPLVDGSGDERPPLGTLHVVTAIQPETDPGSSDNAARMVVLDHELSEEGIRSIRAVGASFDGEHAEESRAVFGLSDEQARKIGLRFGQVAVFAWRGPQWSLVACATDRQTHRAWRWVAQEG